MNRRKRQSKFLKNRHWKARFAHKLRGKIEDVCDDDMCEMIDQEIQIKFFAKGARKR